MQEKLLTDTAEKGLFQALSKVKQTVGDAVAAGDYAKVLATVAPLRPAVDAFFDEVMVMHEDRAMRENRVRLLMEISALFGAVADFSKLQTETKAA